MPSTQAKSKSLSLGPNKGDKMMRGIPPRPKTIMTYWKLLAAYRPVAIDPSVTMQGLHCVRLEESAADLRKLRVSAPTPTVRTILSGRYWVSDQNLPLRLAHLGFLPADWSLLRDLRPRREERAMQKVHELICWWRVGNRVARRHSLAAELNGRFADEAEAPSADELNFLRSEKIYAA